MDRDSTITFGKHKGKTVSDVMDEAPQYLVWAHENVGFFKLPDALLAEAFEKAKASILRRRAEQASRLTGMGIRRISAGIGFGPRGEAAQDAYDMALDADDCGDYDD